MFYLSWFYSQILRMFFFVFLMNVTTPHTHISGLKWQPSLKRALAFHEALHLRATKHNILTHFDIPSQHFFLKTINYISILHSLKLCTGVVQYFTQPFCFKLTMKHVLCMLIVHHPPSLGGGGSLESQVKPKQNQCIFSSISNHQYLLHSSWQALFPLGSMRPGSTYEYSFTYFFFF